MRHKKKFNHLGRQKGHREAMLANMAASLIMHKRIKTTTAKAKALKMFVEPLITKAKEDTTHNRRTVFSYLQDKDATSELFREVIAKVGDRPGGYTRIIKLGARLGDSADMCLIELVDYNENMLAEKAAEKKSSSRRRRGSGKKSTEQAVAAEAEVATAEVEAPEAPEAEVADAPEVEADPATDAVVEETPAAEAPAQEEAPAEEAAPEAKADETPEAKSEEPKAEDTPDAEEKKED